MGGTHIYLKGRSVLTSVSYICKATLGYKERPCLKRLLYYICVYVCGHACGGQRTTPESQFSSTMYMLRIQLWSGLLASTLPTKSSLWPSKSLLFQGLERWLSKCLPYKQEDLSLDLSTYIKVGHNHTQSIILAWGPEDSHSLAKMVSPRFNKKPSEKQACTGFSGTHL